MYRLFVAIDLPEEIRHGIALLKENIPGLRWVPEHQLHLTLRFIGDADDEMLAGIKASLTAVRQAPFLLALRDAGYFPPRGLPRVLWLGIKPCPSLIELQQKIEHECRIAGVAPESRPYSPHLTIARIRNASPASVQQFISRHAGFRCEPFEVNAFHLYASTLTQQGALHQCLTTVTLY